MPNFIEELLEILKSVLAVLVIILTALMLISLFHPAFGATPAEECDIKGGIWTKTYCAPPDMNDEEITYAQRYTILKEIEMREMKDD
ncbi:Uncharacterised protein [[Actinobacillus] rossii]|uniref:Uncharacterized protein n=1 Tax=[Actinobacillus] rossii TaxID=123820 RepID=A0A380TXY2_9PAST|nr:Uncharacterised protein [[Actinobacillus] rossii]